MFTSNYKEPKTKWVAYDNGSYEPVDRKGDLRYKSRSRNEPDWWVEDKSPDWRPEKYAKTKRGQKAKQELGYTSSSERTNKNPIERANPMRPTFIQEDTDHNAPSLPKTTWSLSKQYPSLIGGGFDEKIAGMVKQNMSQQNMARQTQQDTPQKQSAMTQPQHKNTGHATAQLGGTEDGKVTVVREGQDSARGNTGTARNSTQDATALKKAEAKQQSQNSTASARDLKVMEQVDEGKVLSSQKVEEKETAEEKQKRMDEQYREAGRWLAKHGQQYARDAMFDFVDSATKNLALRKDVEELLRFREEHPDVPWFTFGQGITDKEFEEARARTRKLINIVDTFVPHKAVEVAGVLSTAIDIAKSDAQTKNKTAATGANIFGLNRKKYNPLVDVLLYEFISKQLENEKLENVKRKNSIAR